MSNNFFLAYILIPIVCYGCNFREFPSIDKIDTSILEYESEHSPCKRKIIIKNLFLSLSSPMDIDEDMRVGYAIKSIKNIYIKTYDKSIIEALNEIKIDGGFGNFVCGFLSYVKNDNTFIEMCGKDENCISFINKCNGISISKNDLLRIIRQ